MSIQRGGKNERLVFFHAVVAFRKPCCIALHFAENLAGYRQAAAHFFIYKVNHIIHLYIKS